MEDDHIDTGIRDEHRDEHGSSVGLTETISKDLSQTKTKIEEKGHEILHTLDTAVTTAKRKLHLDHVHASGPLKRFNPTTIQFNVRYTDDNGRETSHDEAENHEVQMLWRARDNRKGRQSVAVPLKRVSTTSPWFKRFKRSLFGFLGNIWTMASTFPYWDMAFWSGWSYSVGSVLFVIDGAFSWGPTAFPSTEFGPGEETYGVPLCFFFGALFYQLGATMAYLEAINDGSFAGSGLKRLLAGHEVDQKKLLDEHIHAFFGSMIPHHHKNHDAEKAEAIADAVDPSAGWETKDKAERPGDVYPAGKAPAPRRGGVDEGAPEEGDVAEYLTWRWWPTWSALRNHHLKEIGYIACTIQLFGATLYGITGIVVLPGILDSLEWWQELGAYWVPQVVASTCFLTAGIMFTLETQSKWWKFEPSTVGWWIGAWATLGSVGFLLSATFGCASDSSSSATYQSSLSSMWGSAAYLLSALFQWYESVNKGGMLAFPNTADR